MNIPTTDKAGNEINQEMAAKVATQEAYLNLKGLAQQWLDCCREQLSYIDPNDERSEKQLIAARMEVEEVLAKIELMNLTRHQLNELGFNQ
jgi:Na+/phosphate symporter